MTTQEILTQVKKAKELGSPLTMEQLIAFFEKKAAKANKRNKRRNKKWASRKTIAEVEREREAFNNSNANTEQYFDNVREENTKRFNQDKY